MERFFPDRSPSPFAPSEVEMPFGGTHSHGLSTSLDTNGIRIFS